jgi:hypothetical protein
MFVVDVKREHNAVAEARKLKIPVVAITDTNADPDLVDYPIAGNDDAIRSVRLILATVAQVITRAQAEYESKSSRRKSAEEAQPAEAAALRPHRSRSGGLMISGKRGGAAEEHRRRFLGQVLWPLNNQLSTRNYFYG